MVLNLELANNPEAAKIMVDDLIYNNIFSHPIHERLGMLKKLKSILGIREIELSEDSFDEPLVQLVAKYANAVGRYGPNSNETNHIRKANVDNTRFLELADSLDRIKKGLESNVH
jgi:hypothetical protein